MSVQIGYWGIRGMGQPVRLLLEASKIPYEEKRYTGPDWFAEDKHKLGLAIPNLPYLIDGDVKISQCNAILLHLAERANMLGSTPVMKAEVNMMWGWSVDFRVAYLKMAYSGEDTHESAKEAFDKVLPGKLAELQMYRESHPTKFLCGDELTYMDVVIYDLLDQVIGYKDSCLSEFPKLQDLVSEVSSVPEIASYVASDKYIDHPYNAPFSQFK